MKPFWRGILCGILLKDKIINTFKLLVFNGLNVFHNFNSNLINIHPKDGIHKIDLVIKVKNEELLHENFLNGFQPGWKYFKNKKVLKIQLEHDSYEYLNQSLNILEFLESIDPHGEHVISLDIPLFNLIGELYLYITYYVNDQPFINVYNKSQLLDFEIKNNSFNILCCSLKYGEKNEYFTNYIKMFVNNKIKITPELLLMNYDKVDESNCSIIVVKNNSIQEYFGDQSIY
uniref:Uncharacterized protein n=1 Tax=viral metagenome TaxID=1070528 RepID=A0A6C0I8F6_9ZZZZ